MGFKIIQVKKKQNEDYEKAETIFKDIFQLLKNLEPVGRFSQTDCLNGGIIVLCNLIMSICEKENYEIDDLMKDVCSTIKRNIKLTKKTTAKAEE